MLLSAFVSPNALTLSRVVAVVPLLFLLSGGQAWQHWGAFFLFVVAASTDLLDGWLARRFERETPLGRLLDPLADKLLVSALLIFLTASSRAPLVAVIVIHAREFAVSGLRQVAAAQGMIIPAAPLGKIKTVAQLAALFLLVCPLPVLHPWGEWMLWLATALTVLSGMYYFHQLRALWR